MSISISLTIYFIVALIIINLYLISKVQILQEIIKLSEDYQKEQDLNGDEKPDVRWHYQDNMIRQKELDTDLDGRMDIIEIYSSKGIMIQSKQDEDQNGTMETTWFYDEKEQPVKGKKDRNQDGKTDIWVYYQSGKLEHIEEDRDHNGKVDFWEYYDHTEAVICRKKDLNGDEVPDKIEKF